MPGIGELIEGAVQQAPQPGRQWMGSGGAFMGGQGNSAVKIVVKTAVACRKTTVRQYTTRR
jgi:hypothetical protein